MIGSIPPNKFRPVSGSLPFKKSIIAFVSTKYLFPIPYGFALSDNVMIEL